MEEVIQMVYESSFLEHHGILGQKWGVRRGTSYPLKPSQHSPAEKRAMKKSNGGRGSIISAMKAKQSANLKKKAEEDADRKKKEEDRRIAEKAKIKEKVIKSRSPAKLYKHADLFTDQELRELRDRLSIERDIKKLDASFSEKGRKFIEGTGVLSESLQKTAAAVDNGTKVYNNVAKVMNALYGTDLKIVGDKGQDKKKVEYTTVTRTKDKSGNDVSITKKWTE